MQFNILTRPISRREIHAQPLKKHLESNKMAHSNNEEKYIQLQALPEIEEKIENGHF